jgi:hypothetical protein
MPFARIARLSLSLIALGCSPSSSSSADSSNGAPPPPDPSTLVGAWQGNVQFTSGPFAPIKDLRFLYVFNLGGTMTESSNYDGAPPVPPAYGVWKQVGPNRFEAKYIFYPTKAPAAFQDISSGGGWMPTGHGVLTEIITLAPDGNSYDSSLKWENFDMAGKPATGGGDATAHATRISF